MMASISSEILHARTQHSNIGKFQICQSRIIYPAKKICEQRTVSYIQKLKKFINQQNFTQARRTKSSEQKANHNTNQTVHKGMVCIRNGEYGVCVREMFSYF